MLLFVFVCLVVTTAAQEGQNYFLQSIDENPGIYFEKYPDFKFSNANWKVIVILEITKNAFDWPLYNKAIQEINTTCKPNDHPGQCANILKPLLPLEKRVQRLRERYYSLTDNLLDIEPTREENNESATRYITKRYAPFGFIGSISRMLFGTLTDEDAQYYVSRFSELKTNQLNIANVVREQFHIVNSNIMKTDTELQNLKNNLFEKIALINNTWSAIEGLTHAYEVLHYGSAIEAVIEEIDLNLQTYNDIYNKLYDLMNTAKLGKLHPDLIQKEQLQNIIESIQRASSDHVFPLRIEHANCEKLIDSSTVRIGYKLQKLLFEVTIPLVEARPTELYKIHGLPIPQDNGITAKIEPKYKFIAISNDKEVYTLMKDEHLSTCKGNHNNKICKHETPMFRKTHRHCEFTMLTRPSINAIKSCPLTILQDNNETWIHLSSIDGWLYSTDENTKLSINCGNNKYENLHIKGIGIVQLKPGCQAETNQLVLTNLPTLGQSIEYLYAPKIHLDLQSIDNKILNKSRFLRKYSINNEPKHILSGLTFSDINKEFDILTESINNEHIHYTKHNNWTIITGVFIFIIVNVTCYYWNSKINKTKKDLDNRGNWTELEALEGLPNPDPCTPKGPTAPEKPPRSDQLLA